MKRALTKEQTAKRLAAIPGLTISDVLPFFYARATKRDKQIARMLITHDELERDGAITSEGTDNGAFVLAWAWVDFSGTKLDKFPND